LPHLISFHHTSRSAFEIKFLSNLCSLQILQLRQRIKTVPDQRIRDLLSKIADNPQALLTMHKITTHAVENKYIDPSNPTSPPSVFQIMRDQKMLALLQEMLTQLAKAGIAQADLPVLMQGLFATKFSTAAAPAPVSADSSGDAKDAAVLGERKAADNAGSAKPASLMDKVKNLFK
jgi:hypothetical protein